MATSTGKFSFVKRAAALAATGLLAISFMAAPALASETISVTGLTANDKITVYQVVKADATNTDSATAGWALTADAGVTLENLVNGVDANEFYTLAAHTSALSSYKVADETVKDNSWTKENAEPGLYIALVTPADVTSAYGPLTIYNAMAVSSDYDSSNDYASVEAKKDSITINKTSDNDGTIAAGQTIDFDIDSKVPVYPESFTSAKYQISDTLTGPITLNRNTITVTLGSGENAKTLTAGTDYTLGGTGNSFTIDLVANTLKNISSATDINVSYTGTVNGADTFSDNVDRINNDAKVEFSNDPNNLNSHKTIEKETNHYVFTIDGNLSGSTNNYTDEVGKVGQDATGTAVSGLTSHTFNGTSYGVLGGAVFTLYSDAECGTAIATATTDSTTGAMTFKGLDAGTYYLKETTVPAGYVDSNKIYTVVIDATLNETGELDHYSVTFKDGSKTIGTTTYSIINAAEADNITVNKGSQTSAVITNTKAAGLPSTGGEGTMLLYVGGAILAGGAAITLVARRRAQAEA